MTLMKPKIYTEQQLLKAVEYACESQKAEDYRDAGDILIGAEDQGKAIGYVLDALYATQINMSSKITIEEIDEYLNEEG